MSGKTKIESVVETLSYVKAFSGYRVLIKLGGSVLDDVNLLKKLCFDLSLLRAAGIVVVIVHGGGKSINKALDQYQIHSHFLNGLRVTSLEAMDVIEMVLHGKINAQLVRTLNAMNIKTIGLSGSDLQLLLCDFYGEDYGFVGSIKKINTEIILQFLATQNQHDGVIPVIAPIGVDESGHAMNINADWAASCIAAALNIQKLIYITDQDGIYDLNQKVISSLNVDELKKLIEEDVVKAGMLIKVKAILNALNAGLDNIHIVNGKNEHSLIMELFTESGSGTVCTINTRHPKGRVIEKNHIAA